MARVRVQVPVEPNSASADNTTPAPGLNGLPFKFTPKNVLILLGIIVVIGFLISLLHDRSQLKNQVNQLSSQASGSDDTQKYQAAVTKLVEVPDGIVPTVKTPTDAELTQLKQDPTYKDTKTGDVFLVYKNPDGSLYVVIYRPTVNKVVLATVGSSGTSNTQTKTKP